MGVGKFVSCKNCGNEWVHYNGIGMNRTYWYCDRCGSSKEGESDLDITIPNINGICSCGGSFIIEDSKNEKIICPKCHNKELDMGDAIFNWD